MPARGRRCFRARTVEHEGERYEVDVDGRCYLLRGGTRRRVKDPLVWAPVLRLARKGGGR